MEKKIDFPSKQKDWKKFELNNKAIALSILFVLYNTEKIRLAYKSTHNFMRKNQVNLLVITDGKRWHYLAVKSLPALLRRITLNHDRDFYCLNRFHSYSTKNKLKRHERVCNDHDYCYVEMPNEDNKILKNNHGEKSLNTPFMTYANLECLLEKMYSCQNNPEKSYTEKKTKHKASGYSLFTNCLFDLTKNKLDFYKGEDCMERFCEDLREHAMKIINYEKKKKKISLTDKENNSYEKQKVCYICKNNLILMEIIKTHLNCTIKTDIIVSTLENLEELLIVFAI